MRKIFGTDGVRGKANKFPMTPEFVLALAKAAGKYFHNGSHTHRVIIGKDTRLSGYMFEPALTSGFVSMGMDVLLLGPLPTPAVSMLTRSMRADLGVMITASHNLFDDNGIKLFGPDGYKLSDRQEMEIEKLALEIMQSECRDNITGDKLGRVERIEDVKGRYIEWIKNSVPKGISFDGLKVVLDCAHGATYKVAPKIFSELGAEVFPLNIEPNGTNINDGCGAVYPEKLCQKVVEIGADIGFAFDGDGDRLIVSDEKGHIVDGDQIIGLLAKAWQEKGLLKNNEIVTTQMSNLGLENFLNDIGIKLTRVDVGDRYVLEYMRQSSCNLGGEQSGHLILSDYATTGDGILAGLQMLQVLYECAQPTSDICHVFKPIPQYLENIVFEGNNPLDDDSVQEAIQAGQEKLSGTGRVFVRKSGTEPKIRVMGEGTDEALVKDVIQSICQAVKKVCV